MKETHDRIVRRTLVRGAVMGAGVASLGVALLISGVPRSETPRQRPRTRRFSEEHHGLLGYLPIDETLEADLWMQ